ncbi:hypothetical protein CIK90_00695 [Prevotella sp. P5-126]|uniref:hypothetical protein n=1 Tax=Prevotella sp. P5-126 TaxID=2024216 RepID=UPI000B9693C9|nr:hypothetical protein [Prevotella sp. P5-126]OYP40924.1 hypothetical protein CIK90_00695 [Prevotella sp. P5-126]
MKKILSILMISLSLSLQISAQQGETGIYYNDKTISFSRIVGKKVGNVAGAYFTFGLSSAKAKINIEGRNSENTVASTKPTFVFKFGDKSPITGDLFANEENVTRFLLVKIKTNGKQRSIIAGKYGLTQIKTNVDSKDIIALKLESKGNGVYEVTPRETLEMGKEYAFYYRQKEEDKSNPFYGVFDFVVKE